MKEYMYSFHYYRNRGHRSDATFAARLSNLVVHAAVFGGLVYAVFTLMVIFR